jgi:hypothetical protein
MRVIVLLLASAGLLAAPGTGDPGALTVHEWGTFTSIAGVDGTPVEWLPQTASTDLPCFVERNQFNVKGSVPGTVRMETPVLYFYAAREMDVNVRIRFRQGVITEWFPRAAVTPGNGQTAGDESTIAWRNVKISPGAAEDFPVERAASHYYAARRTNAAPLQSGSVKEKFLFYRGVGRFALPIAATVDADGKVTVRNPRSQSIGDVILFDNHRGRIVYEVRRAAGGQVIVDPAVVDREPTLELETMLLANGLYPEEASAMIDTWRDSWFEEGTRLFYIVPRPRIDAVLPLAIDPTPDAVARVFVGRMELVTPATEREIAAALLANDVAALQRYGRFLHAIGRRIVAEAAPGDRAPLERRLQKASAILSAPPYGSATPQDACGGDRRR